MEMCLDGVWSAIYVYDWDAIKVSIVTCKQLGFPSECELLTLCSKNTLMTTCYHPTQGRCLYMVCTLVEEMLPCLLLIFIAVEMRVTSQTAHYFQYRIYRIILFIILMIIFIIMIIMIIFIIIILILWVLSVRATAQLDLSVCLEKYVW